MKNEQLWKDIEALCALRGPSGREDAVREYLIHEIEGHAAYEVDPLGNLLVRKKGRAPARRILQLSAQNTSPLSLWKHLQPSFRPLTMLQ